MSAIDDSITAILGAVDLLLAGVLGLLATMHVLLFILILAIRIIFPGT